MTTPDPFHWHEEGESGLAIPSRSEAVIAHEVLYEDQLTHIKDRPMYMGASIPAHRFNGFFLCAGGLILFLLGRAFWMQIIQGETYRVQAEQNRLRHETVLPKRGIIRDRVGTILADNIPSFEVRGTERFLPDQSNIREELLAKVGRVIGSSVGDIESVFASSTDPDEPTVLKRDISYERAVALKVIGVETSGIEVVVSSKRRYPASAAIQSLSHLLGYISGITPEELVQRKHEGYRQIDTIGKSGVEFEYEKMLRGTPGENIYEVDAQHQKTGVVGHREATDGADVTLSIHLDLQRAADEALRAELMRANVTRGAAIAMNPQTGEILAAVSLPAYDNNIFSGTVSSTVFRALLQNPDHPLLPRLWAGSYPSGSTIKPVVATAALAEGIIQPQTAILSNGGIRIGPWFFPDWKAGGHGATNVRKAIAWSVNTFFYYIGGGYGGFVGLGVERLTDWMQRFGLGQKTGLDLPGEVGGFVPSQTWKERTKNEHWFIGDTYNLSIGQGDLLVTPLQVARFTAMIANGGFPIAPHIILGADEYTTTTHSRIASADIIQTVRLGMRDTVVYGSGRALSSLPFSVAGKTGTAQWRSDKANHAWFTSFAPFENPQIVVTVLIEEGVEGSTTAILVAKDILQAWYKQSSQPAPKK